MMLTNASLSTELAIYSRVVEASCPLGYHFPDFTTVIYIQCEEFGVWNDTVNSCIGESSKASYCRSRSKIYQGMPNEYYTFSHCSSAAATCEELPTVDDNVEHHSEEMEVYVFNSSVSYLCSDGLRFENGHQLLDTVCVGKDLWSMNNLTCEGEVCRT